jgi:hypothetical protein
MTKSRTPSLPEDAGKDVLVSDNKKHWAPAVLVGWQQDVYDERDGQCWYARRPTGHHFYYMYAKIEEEA